ncbi:MAG TPA: hypothetical protein VII99_04370, partial [Bacteroidia bacterium]
RATDEQTQLKIIRSGMKLWIDTTGKNKKITGLFFPIESGNEQRNSSAGHKHEDTARANTKQFQKPSSKSIKARYNKAPKEMQLVGFKPPLGGIMPLQNESGIAASIDWDSIGIMTYEAILPFKTFYKKSLAAADSAKKIGITLIIPALAAPPSSGGHREGGGGMGGGMGGMGGGMGGMRGAGGGYGGGGRRGGGNYGGGNTGTGMLYENNTIKMIIKPAIPSKHSQ